MANKIRTRRMTDEIIEHQENIEKRTTVLVLFFRKINNVHLGSSSKERKCVNPVTSHSPDSTADAASWEVISLAKRLGPLCGVIMTAQKAYRSGVQDTTAQPATTSAAIRVATCALARQMCENMKRYSNI